MLQSPLNAGRSSASMKSDDYHVGYKDSACSYVSIIKLPVHS